MSKKYYYEEQDFKLIQGDSLKILKEIEPKSIDMIFAAPLIFCLVMVFLVMVEKWYQLIKVIGINLSV